MPEIRRLFAGCWIEEARVPYTIAQAGSSTGAELLIAREAPPAQGSF